MLNQTVEITVGALSVKLVNAEYTQDEKFHTWGSSEQEGNTNLS